jgi:hypothetical protein
MVGTIPSSHRLVRALVAIGLLAAGASKAAPLPRDAGDESRISNQSDTGRSAAAAEARPFRMEKLVWAGVGFDSFGGSAAPGFSVGAAIDIVPLSPDVSLDIFGNADIALLSEGGCDPGCGNIARFPLSAGGLAHYHGASADLAAGLGFTVLPFSGGTNAGLGFFLIGLLPVIRQAPSVCLMGQLQYHSFSSGGTLFAMGVGVAVGF